MAFKNNQQCVRNGSVDFACVLLLILEESPYFFALQIKEYPNTTILFPASCDLLDNHVTQSCDFA